MIRRLFLIATALSLLLFVACAVAWARSESIGDSLRYYEEPRDFEVQSNGGLVRVAWGSIVSRRYPPPVGWEGSFWPFRRRVDRIDADLRRGTAAGFASTRWQRRSAGFTADERSVTLPWWLPTACFGLLPCLATGFFWRRRRAVLEQGRCLTCGYDLRGIQERCPECGRAIVSREGAKA